MHMEVDKAMEKYLGSIVTMSLGTGHRGSSDFWSLPHCQHYSC